MAIRLFILVVLFTQCSSSSQLAKKQFDSASASYMRYISGAGGGKGILFKVPLKQSTTDISIDRFVVNGIEIEANREDSLIVGSVFYVDPEPTMDNPNPEPIDPVLFNQDTFKAIIYFSTHGITDSVEIQNFTEEEQPLYP